MDSPYSGAAIRNAHFSSRPPVPGLNRDHFTPDPEPDPFSPVPTPDHNQTGTILTNTPEDAPESNLGALGQPIGHWYDGQPSVPSAVPYPRAQQAMQERMMVDHSDRNMVPDTYRRYTHYSQGQNNQWVVGRMPQNAGEDPGERLQYLVNGNNSYDHTNQPKPEVYGGDAANVGRYRLGRDSRIYGLYQNPIGKFGQDAQLHAYTGLTPQLPQAKPQMKNTAPYTPNSTGTAHWVPAPFAQIPSFFGLPSETSMTDVAVVNDFGGGGGSEYTDG